VLLFSEEKFNLKIIPKGKNIGRERRRQLAPRKVEKVGGKKKGISPVLPKKDAIFSRKNNNFAGQRGSHSRIEGKEGISVFPG